MTAQPVFILVEPQLPENIGAAARAMLNCGLDRMRLVSPRPEWPNERAQANSAGADRVLEAAKLCRSVPEAVGDLRVVFAATARPRDLAKRVLTPRAAAAELRALAEKGIAAGLLFGPERAGLLNDDVASCDAVITVPLNPEFSSLNLAQAVLLLAYEWMIAADETPGSELRLNGGVPAERRHLLSLLERLEFELDQCGFLRVPHMRAAMVRNIRALFARARPTDQEVRTLHGILTELVNKRLFGARRDDDTL